MNANPREATLTEPSRDDVTLHTLHEDMTAGFAGLRADMTAGFAGLHEDLTAGFAEMRAGFADLKTEMRAGFGDLKATMVAGFRSLPTRESSEEMVRLLREGNRLDETRFVQLDLRIREQHLETQQVLHAVVESQRQLLEGQRMLGEEQRSLSADIRALIARIDGLIRGRDNGEPAA
jgi:hypothetical protein